MKRILLIFLAPLVLVLFSADCSDTRDKSQPPEERSTSGSIIPNKEYTFDNPGVWAGKENEHLPEIRILDKELENILISVPLDNKDGKHYIEKIGIMDEKGHTIVYVPFSRHTRFFLAKMTLYPIPRDKNLKVFVKCNLHDTWTAPLEDTRDQ